MNTPPSVENLDGLIQQIRREGVERAQREADALIAAAKQQAAEIVQAAEQRAAQLIGECACIDRFQSDQFKLHIGERIDVKSGDDLSRGAAFLGAASDGDAVLSGFGGAGDPFAQKLRDHAGDLFGACGA